ncbi:type VII secretion protein EccCb [[Mycobacterium] zoologicum]|uniref:type VII secretion protein EccCb n=1 Tax=[Mycobacterium] zoologicum TaxID=2872311 RepID=UPI00272A4D04|nr:type VII secretion protein EccCb [Mycolicibacter sp. MYC101]MEB3063005.1 type VII secretion protein EccCb [Mycolicibacter sp. MYC101]
MTELRYDADRPVMPHEGEICVAAPPSVTRPEAGAMLIRLLPVVMAVGMLGATAVLYRSGSPRSPAFAMLPLMMLASAVLAVLGGRHRGRSGDIDDDREGYLDYLAGLRDSVRITAAAQRAAVTWAHPEPDALWILADGPRRWERRPADPDFGRVRVGIGTAGLITRLVAPAPAGPGVIDPVTDTALSRFLDVHATVPDVPVTLPLLGSGPLMLDGEPDRMRGLLRAMICQLAVLHGPDVVTIAVESESPTRWDWLKWLPHHQHSAPAFHAAPAGPRAVVIVDDHSGLSVVDSAGVGGAVRRLPPSEFVRADFLSVADAVVCAQRLAGHRVTRSGGPDDWAALLGIDDIEGFDPAARWAGGADRRLCVPIGTDADASPVCLDINEAAERGSGPHGLCVGATGSGKSEFLRTLVLGMTVTHAPQDLNLVLVDFKGGATFLGFEQTAHVAAIITNLADEAPLVERMQDALSGEMHRRQELLRAAGASGIAGYNAARQGAPPLPALLVIVDEFSELLDQQPEFLDTFVAVGRLGRSLGIHLLLASQRLEEGRLRGLESHLSYRICLKTTSAAESRIVLGVPDAYELPNAPGAGYLRTADGEVTRFQTAFVSGDCPDPRPVPRRAQPFHAVSHGTAASHEDPAPRPSGRTVLQAILGRLAGHGPPARRVWLPPLGEAPALGELLDGQRAGLCVPIGVVDRPFEQRRTPLTVRLDGAAGHVAVVGAPQSGKSTTLHTLIAALCATHDATRVAFYCLDFGGGGLDALDRLPQVGSVAGSGRPELVRRTVAEMEAILERRETGCCGEGEPAGHVFLVIDGWAALGREFDVEARIIALAGRGLSFGVHVVLSANRWADVRPALRDLIGTRIELRLGDPAESELGRRQAQRVPQHRPGRGVTADGLHMQVARPDGWSPIPSAAVAPPIALLPAVIDRASLDLSIHDRPVLGIDECGLAAVAVDFERQPHLLILGDNECGKTAALRTLCRELMRTHSADQVQIFVVDYRRSLLGVVTTEHLAGYAMSAPALTTMLPRLVDRLAGRMPGAELTAQQLRARSWWSGPQLYVVVDDYDLVATAAGNPLTPLLEYLPHAGDLGLHLVVARRSGGAARSMYEPLLAALLDLGAMGLLMSGDAADAPLMGSVRPGPLPPGRGILLTRTGGEQRIQVAWEP